VPNRSPPPSPFPPQKSLHLSRLPTSLNPSPHARLHPFLSRPFAGFAWGWRDDHTVASHGHPAHRHRLASCEQSGGPWHCSPWHSPEQTASSDQRFDSPRGIIGGCGCCTHTLPHTAHPYPHPARSRQSHHPPWGCNHAVAAASAVAVVPITLPIPISGTLPIPTLLTRWLAAGIYSERNGCW
jgi:hypothetical protein